MGYEFLCGLPIAIGVALAVVLGLFITLERLEDWAAELINKHRDYHSNKQSQNVAVSRSARRP